MTDHQTDRQQHEGGHGPQGTQGRSDPQGQSDPHGPHGRSGPPGHHHAHGGSHDPSGGTGAAEMIELLDLDAEVLHAYLAELTGWIGAAVGEPPPRRIVDLGSGSGAGTFALLRQFGGAESVAVDRSPEMLRHVEGAARERGLAGRVRTVEADLDGDWPDVGPADLVWASASFHHLADPDRALARAAAVLRPGGALALVELESFPRFLPEDIGIGRPGLEARCFAAADRSRTEELPDLGSDWGPRLAAAGFAVRAERRFDIELASELPAATGRYARATLRRVRDRLGGVLDPEDTAALAALVDGDGPEALVHRRDLTVRTTRTAWVGVRP